MTRASESSRSLFDRLWFRLALFLSLAILPIGLIAVAQSYRTVEEAQQRSEAALLGSVGRAVATEQQLIQTALGAATALGHSVLPLLSDPDRCREMLTSYVEASPDFIFAGFTEADGRMRCVSSGNEVDFSRSELFERVAATPGPAVELNETGAITQQPVLIVTHPIRRNGGVKGFMSISVPFATLDAALLQRQIGPRPFDIITFNRKGVILTADGDRADAERRLPAGVALGSFVDGGATAFTGHTRDGVARVFTVVPVVDGEVYAIGSWPLNARFVQSEVFSATVFAFPVLMWLASVLVAYFAVHRLVIAHLGTLRSAMRRFALGNRDLAPLRLEGGPKEIRDIGETFDRMRLIITRDEADLENALHERGVLLKEVHHRVKNNLQLITSIISMQIRQTNAPELRAMLRRVQERVLSLATIHRSLYQSADLADLRVDTLIREIVNQMAAMTAAPGSNIAVECRLDPLTLDPDHAVPLSLAVSEAVTNALKHRGMPDDDGQAWVRVELVGPDAAGIVRLEVANSLGRSVGNPDPADGSSGIGENLIEAFAAQLNATIERRPAAESFSVIMEFPLVSSPRSGGNAAGSGA